jgi:hypothetical protein
MSTRLLNVGFALMALSALVMLLLPSERKDEPWLLWATICCGAQGMLMVIAAGLLRLRSSSRNP